MTSVVFELDLLDNNDRVLEIDLEEFSDYCVTHELDFVEEFKKRVWNWMVYSSSDGFSVDYDPQVYSIHLAVEPSVGQVEIDLIETGDIWDHLAKQLEGIVDYGAFVSWDDDGELRLAAFLAYVESDGWRWEELTFKSIKERMETFRGVYSYKSEVVDELIEEGTLDPVPDWVCYNEDDSAEEAERMGYYSSYGFGWRHAVWV